MTNPSPFSLRDSTVEIPSPLKHSEPNFHLSLTETHFHSKEIMENIKHFKTDKKGSFYYEIDGKKLAEMFYVLAGEKKMIIDHTEVDESLKGQGIGRKLQAELVDYVRANDMKVIPLCPFANANFQKTKEWQDVLA
jgi:uncharacterized protein